MEKTSAIKYNAEIFNLVQDLVPINNSIVFEKSSDNKKVLVKRADSEMTVAYILEAPVEYFDFPADKVAFYNYNEFYQFFSTFKSSPSLVLNENKITLFEENAKTDYIISNPESLPVGPKTIRFKDPNIKFNLTSNDLDDLSKMNTLIKAKRAKLYGNENEINIKLFSSMHDNSYENKFKVEAVNNFVGEYDFVIFSELFAKLPQKREYTIEIIANGWVKVSLVDKNLNLNIYTACIND